MSQPNQQETSNKRVRTTEGHFVRWEISGKDLQVMRTWLKMKTFRTSCKVAKTSWDFKLCFPQVREDGTSSLSIALTRSDSLDSLGMGVFLWVDVFDSNKNEIYRRKRFSQVGVMPAGEIVETVELVPNSNMEDAVKQKVVVVVTLTVFGCHAATASKE